MSECEVCPPKYKPDVPPFDSASKLLSVLKWGMDYGRAVLAQHHALIASKDVRIAELEAALSHVVNHCDCVTISPKCGCVTIAEFRDLKP